jgi:hypothetical protein
MQVLEINQRATEIYCTVWPGPDDLSGDPSSMVPKVPSAAAGIGNCTMVVSL